MSAASVEDSSFVQTSPVISLPPEILANVFLYRKAVSPVTPKRRSKVKHDWKWIQVSHVCRRWRQVALQNPTLWSTIPPISPKWLEVMAERSQRLPLTIELGSEATNLRPYRSTLANVFKSHTSRLRAISLHGKGSLIDSILSSMPTGPVPILQILSISVERVLPSIWANLPLPPLPKRSSRLTSSARGSSSLRTLRLHTAPSHRLQRCH
ncbi:hypothetical protein BKA70DRAFT_527148 [Coprinopsis sp. MPI-PUGE-AT-0042]|nr:hypothetical protein BKA70DRAFT_527148 [Coprinopsis sp. MPI-PUGE-AT-0042]